MKKIIVLFIIILIAPSLYGYDWSSRNVVIDNKEVKAKGDVDETTLSMTGSGNTKFTVRFTGAFNETFGPAILDINKMFRQWKYMSVKTIDFVVGKDILQAIIIPSKFTYKGKDILKSLPAGMMFSYKTGLNYNFRINVEKIFIRIQGKFLNEELLCNKIHKAIIDPISFLTMYNPKYMLKKIMQHQDSLKELAENYSILLKKHNKLVNAVMTLHNTGFLGFGINEIDKKIVRRVIELKTASTKITKKQILEKLEKEKLKASDDEISLVLNVYYNEFD